MGLKNCFVLISVLWLYSTRVNAFPSFWAVDKCVNRVGKRIGEQRSDGC